MRARPPRLPCNPLVHPRPSINGPVHNHIHNHTHRPHHRTYQLLTPSQTTSIPLPDSPATHPDARFDTLAPTHNLLSVSLTASTPLHTRRGSLVGFSGPADRAVSTVSPLSPLLRAPLAIPWLYQRITTTAPVDLLIAARGRDTSFAVVRLDGTTDWKILRRDGLVAWVGERLVVEPSLDRTLPPSKWPSTLLTGRGLTALAAPGPILTLQLSQGESYTAHPSHVLAFSIGSNPPERYRLPHSSLNLQIPSFSGFLPDWPYFDALRRQRGYQVFMRGSFEVRAWVRRVVYGDRLFLRFWGPGTVLLQGRGSGLRDVVREREGVEVADAPAGGLGRTFEERGASRSRGKEKEADATTPGRETSLSYASVDRAGRVSFSPSREAS